MVLPHYETRWAHPKVRVPPSGRPRVLPIALRPIRWRVLRSLNKFKRKKPPSRAPGEAAFLAAWEAEIHSKLGT